jgi:hypothetical protein
VNIPLTPDQRIGDADDVLHRKAAPGFFAQEVTGMEPAKRPAEVGAEVILEMVGVQHSDHA